MRYFITLGDDNETPQEVTLEWLLGPSHKAALNEPQKPPYHIPGPYEIALAIAQGLCASGRYDTPGAAMGAAWASVPEYFAGRDAYLRLAGALFQGRSSEEYKAVQTVGGEENLDGCVECGGAYGKHLDGCSHS